VPFWDEMRADDDETIFAAIPIQARLNPNYSMNPYGRYGSPFPSDRIYNPNGTYNPSDPSGVGTYDPLLRYR
jgi:hypothetical protein